MYINRTAQTCKIHMVHNCWTNRRRDIRLTPKYSSLASLSLRLVILYPHSMTFPSAEGWNFFGQGQFSKIVNFSKLSILVRFSQIWHTYVGDSGNCTCWILKESNRNGEHDSLIHGINCGDFQFPANCYMWIARSTSLILVYVRHIMFVLWYQFLID